MAYKREIFGGKELINFFCKDSTESNKEYCRYVVNFENKSFYNGSDTSYEDGDILYKDLLNPNVKWKVMFDKHSELLLFENGDKYVEFDGVDYDYAKDFFLKQRKNKYKKNMGKGSNNNGYEYVDLGLPSGTLWATMNVGASKPSDAGLYFQWGDTQGYIADQVGTGEGQKKFVSNESDYKFGVYPNYSKYTTKGATLDLEDDAAHVHMGGSWHMPTPTQIQELLSNTTNTWTTQDDVNGRLFTSKSDTSKSIFIPAAGCADDGSLQGSGAEADVWSSMLSTGHVCVGQNLYFNSDYANLYSDGGRYCGFSVRGVIG